MVLVLIRSLTPKNENIEVPAGTLQQKNSELVVQIQSKVIHPLGFGDLVIANKNGSPIFLKQVATVEDTQAELQSSAFIMEEQRFLSIF